MIICNTVTGYQLDPWDKDPQLEARIEPQSVNLYLPLLERYLGSSAYHDYTHKQQMRDNFSYHMTIVNAAEYRMCNKKLIDSVIGYPLHILVFGIGAVEETSNATYFLVCKCDEADCLRIALGLDFQDHHITLGFKKHDIFGVPKDASTLIRPFSVLEPHSNEIMPRKK